MVWLSQKPDRLRVSIKVYTATDAGNQAMSAFLMTLPTTSLGEL